MGFKWHVVEYDTAQVPGSLVKERVGLLSVAIVPCGLLFRAVFANSNALEFVPCTRPDADAFVAGLPKTEN